jgi:GNAT superfamily N-acetyltransferase
VVTIEELDPFDDDQMKHYHAVYDESERHESRYACPETLGDLAIRFRSPSEYEMRLGFFARQDGDMVAAGLVLLPLRDNVSLADVDVHVLPAHRRKGLGTRMAMHLAQVARAHDRTTWNGWLYGRDLDEPEGTLRPGEHFATRLGMSLKLLDVQRRLPLPVPPDRLRHLLDTAAEHHSGYSFVSWVDHCPDQHVAAYCALKAAMNSLTPLGDLEVEVQHWDEGRVREEEAMMSDSGRSRHVVVAVAPDGSLAGHNELVLSEHEPDVVWQWDTLVLHQHQGHRLGLALKVRNLRDVQAAHPERTHVRTFNADANTHMIAVNEAMGFVPVSYLGEWQGPVPA